MNDDFLYRLRAQPSLTFAMRLKAQLDLQTTAAAARKRFLLVAALVIGGASFAFVSTPVRKFAAETLGIGVTNSESQSDASAPIPFVAKVASRANPTTTEVRRPLVPATQQKTVGIQPPVHSINLSDSTPSRASADPAETSMHQLTTNNTIAPSSIGIANRLASGDVRIDGSSTVFPITEAVAEEFQIQNRGHVRVTVGISGTGGGFKKFCRGEIDIADASRPILKAEMEACAAAGIKYIELPVAYDALTVVVNPKATWVDQITVAQLKTMWEPAAQGRVLKWNHIDTNWPNLPLQLFGPGADSGSFDYFTEVVNGKSKASRGDFTSSEDDNVLVLGVAQNESALGYFGFAYFVAHRDKLKALRIVNSKGQAVAPSAAAVTDGTYHPLARPLFIYVNAASAKKPLVKEFVEFYLTEGRPLVSEVGYAPLTPRTYQTALTHFRSNKLGTVFGGVSEIGVGVEEALKREGAL